MFLEQSLILIHPVDAMYFFCRNFSQNYFHFLPKHSVSVRRHFNVFIIYLYHVYV